jgi:hypothetical protein
MDFPVAVLASGEYPTQYKIENKGVYKDQLTIKLYYL